MEYPKTMTNRKGTKGQTMI